MNINDDIPANTKGMAFFPCLKSSDPFFQIQISFLQLMSREHTVHDVAYYVITGMYGGGSFVQMKFFIFVCAHELRMKQYWK